MGRESVTVVSSPPAATALAPGFRFHPTDEELVSYYLKRKVQNKPVRFDAIGVVDIYKHEPWNLGVFSRLKTRDQEWYFFSALDKKYGNGARMNRATNNGYWKATGKDREIRSDVQLLGMKKTLVFHSGRAPDGLRTNWVMHEYRLVEYETEENGNLLQDAYALCRVFHKKNIGPPSGNRYAPFMEEEWANDGETMIPGIRTEPNGNNQMEQSARKDLININELPRETTLGDTKHEHAEEEEEEEEEAPLPLIQYKRKRQKESNNNSRRTTEDDHCSSSPITNTAISELLEFSLIDISEKMPRYHKEASYRPPSLASACDLQKEIDEMCSERDSFKLEMMSAESMISILQSRIDALRQENNELRKNNLRTE